MGMDEDVLAVTLLTGFQGGQLYSSTKNANELKKQQKKQLALQRKVSLITARREARIKAASFAAGTSGAGVSGSVITGTDIGSQTSLQSGFSTAESQYAIQADQINLAADAQKQTAFFNFAQSLVSMASGGYSAGAFNETPSPEPTTNSEPVGTYFLRPQG